jgi:DnaA family protein
MEQLSLAVDLKPESDFAEYLPGPNAEAVAALSAWAACRGEPFLYLFGAPGTGKTHLLHAACRSATANRLAAVYLPLSHAGLDPSALDNLQHCALVALDDINAVAGDLGWERALFSLYNRLREAGCRLLVSADAPSAQLPLQLPDLRSRLGWCPGYQLRRLDDTDCERLLRDAAARRGLRLDATAITYILRRCPRDASRLLALLDRLDQVSLEQKRRPSVRLIGELLKGWQD